MWGCYRPVWDDDKGRGFALDAKALSGWAAEADRGRDDNCEEQEEFEETAVKVSSTKRRHNSCSHYARKNNPPWFLRSRTLWQQGA